MTKEHSIDCKAQLLPHVREVDDFPKPGIRFFDLNPLYAEARLFELLVTGLAVRIEPATAIHGYIELLHNTKRRDRVLNKLTPVEIETQFLSNQLAARFLNSVSFELGEDHGVI